MPDYAFRTIESRRKIEEMWETGKTAREISEEMKKPIKVIYKEIQRGQDGSELPNMRLRYSAELAQRRMEESLRNRGNRRAVPPCGNA